MSKMIAMAVKERKVTILLSIFVIMYGLYAYYFLPRQENPDTSSPAVQIVTVYPGATAKDVEEQVTKKIEDEIAALDGVDVLDSFSQDNVSIVIGLLENDVDYDAQWDKLRVGIENLSNTLPDGVEKPSVNTELTTTPGIIISISSDGYDAGQLTEFAKRVKEQINDVEGVKRVEVKGEQKKRINITIDEKALYALDISIEDVYNIIRSQNVVIPPGAIKTKDGKINVQVPKSLNNISDFEDVILTVSKENGSVVRLKDIAKIDFEYDEGTLYYTKNGRSSVLVTGVFKDNENVVLIGNDVRRVIDNIKKTLPEGIIFDEVLFQPEDVNTSVNDFVINLLQGVVFVIIVILIGMGYRNAIVVSIAIPLSIAMTFISMQVFKIDLQQVSISALIIALGMLVDNAIVISDAIQVKINEGVENAKAAYLGAKEQAIPVLTSTLTTVAAFTPLVSLPGAAGEFVKSLPFVVIVALISSYVVAMLVTPALASINLRERHIKRDILLVISRFYTSVLKFNLRRPVVTLLAILIFLVGSVYLLFTQVDIRMFPYVDKDVVYININNEVVGDIDNTHALVLEVEKLLAKQPEITEMTLSTGGGLPRFYITADFIMPSESNGQIYAEFDLSKGGRFNNRGDFLYHLQTVLDQNFVGGYATAELLEINMPGATIEARISGASEEELVEVGEKVYNFLVSQNETMNVQILRPEYRYQYQLDVDDARAIQHGLSAYDIQYQINLALNGSKVSTLNADGQSYDIYLQSDIHSIEQIENLKIKSRFTKEKILVKQIAKVKLQLEVNEIRRVDRKSVVIVRSDVRPQFGSGSVQKSLEDFIGTLSLDQMKVQYGGDQDTIARYLSGLGVAAIFAVVAIYIILIIQFNSFVQPFVILTTLPLALIGVILGLVVTGTNFTFTVGLGAASLIGIVVNNGILLIEYINRARSEGMSVIDACMDSVSKRMRPILLSTVTTIFGLVPLVFTNSSFFTPMSIALIGGLLVATIMTLTIVPTVYSVLTKIERPKVEIDI